MASSIGTSHLASSQPCQDSHRGAILKDADGRDVLLLVASDGAGSASVADVGAALTCRIFAKLVEEFLAGGGEVEHIGRPLVERWIAGIVSHLAHQASQEGLALQDYACTLLAAIMSDDVAMFAQIGDGAIVVSSKVGVWDYVFWPQHGEFANSTNFVTSENSYNALEFAVRDAAIEEIAVFTDGIESLVLRKADKVVHAPFFDSMFKSVRRSRAPGRDEALCRELEKYLASQPIIDRTHDDKTLMLATRRRAAPGASWEEVPA